MAQSINQYLNKRYRGLLDYAVFHCTRAGIPDDASDVLDEVLLSLLQKDESELYRLLNTPSRCGRYLEIDILILRMIKLNCYSETAPYRAKCKPIPSVDKDLSRLNIEDVQDEEIDHPGYVLGRMREIRELITSMGFSEKAMAIFEYRFFEDGSVKQWPGVENEKEIYCIYNKVLKLIKMKINGELLI